MDAERQDHRRRLRTPVLDFETDTDPHAHPRLGHDDVESDGPPGRYPRPGVLCRKADGGDVHARRRIAVAIHAPRRVQHQQPGLVDFDARPGDPGLDIGEVRDPRTEGASFQRPLAHQFEREIALPDAAHAGVDAPRTQARLRHGEIRAFVSQQRGGGHPHVPKHQFAMALDRLVIHHRDVTFHHQSRRPPPTTAPGP